MIQSPNRKSAASIDNVYIYREKQVLGVYYAIIDREYNTSI